LNKLVFGKDFDIYNSEEIFLNFSEKNKHYNASDKFLLVKIISNQIIEFIFEIYDLLYKIIKI
jgi:hypothetical protein